MCRKLTQALTGRGRRPPTCSVGSARGVSAGMIRAVSVNVVKIAS